jgi:hypothetical protein
MHKLIAAALVAASTLAVPAAVQTASAVEIDCTDPQSPGNRPGGFCSQDDSGTSLSAPVTAAPIVPDICLADARGVVLPKWARVHVAVVTLEYLCEK